MDKPEEMKQPLIMKTPEGTVWVHLPDYQALESKLKEYKENNNAPLWNETLNKRMNQITALEAKVKELENETEEVQEALGEKINDYIESRKADDAKIKELETKCKNLDEIIGSLDVKDPNACDALLNVQLINQKTIHELKLENKALRDMYDGAQIVLSEVRAELSTTNKKAERLVEAAKSLTTWIKAKGGHGYETHGLSENLEQALKEYRGEK